MNLKELRIELKDWAVEIANTYPNQILARYEEPVNTYKETIFTLDVLLKKWVQEDNYGYVLSVRIFQNNNGIFTITVDLCEGGGKILNEKEYVIGVNFLAQDDTLNQSLIEDLRNYKKILFLLLRENLE